MRRHETKALSLECLRRIEARDVIDTTHRVKFACGQVNTRAAQALSDRGCWFLFLPTYSPDLNPIEMAFSKLKAILRGVGARTFDHLLQALGDICNLFTPDECWNYFRHAGYIST